jgi:hypothetical protein
VRPSSYPFIGSRPRNVLIAAEWLGWYKADLRERGRVRQPARRREYGTDELPDEGGCDERVRDAAEEVGRGGSVGAGLE